jgi:hypothetical protein
MADQLLWAVVVRCQGVEDLTRKLAAAEKSLASAAAQEATLLKLQVRGRLVGQQDASPLLGRGLAGRHSYLPFNA